MGEWVAVDWSKREIKIYGQGVEAENYSYTEWLKCHGYKGPFPSDPAEEIHKATNCECHKPKET